MYNVLKAYTEARLNLLCGNMYATTCQLSRERQKELTQLIGRIFELNRDLTV